MPLENNFDFIRSVSSKSNEFVSISTSGNLNKVMNSHCHTIYLYFTSLSNTIMYIIRVDGVHKVYTTVFLKLKR